MLPPNFLAAARAPAPPAVPGLLALGTPAAEAAPADGGTAEAAAPPGPETAAGPALAAAAAAAPAAGPGGIVAVGKEAAGGLSRLAGSAAARAVPVLGTLGQILRSDPAQGPGLGPEQEALVGRRPFDPTPLAEQAVAASKPLLADGFAAPGVSGAVFSLRPDVALAPLPGFAPAVPDLGTEGVTVLPEDAVAPLPGLAPAVPDLGMKGFSAAPPLGLTLPGFGIVDSDFVDAEFLENRVPGPFTSNDPLVGELANILNNTIPGIVQDVNVQILRQDGTKLTDYDIQLTDGTVIQVKSGGGKGLTSQIETTAATTGRRVIAYGPHLGGTLERSLRQRGYEVFRNPQSLVEALRSAL